MARGRVAGRQYLHVHVTGLPVVLPLAAGSLCGSHGLRVEPMLVPARRYLPSRLGPPSAMLLPLYLPVASHRRDGRGGEWLRSLLPSRPRGGPPCDLASATL